MVRVDPAGTTNPTYDNKYKVSQSASCKTYKTRPKSTTAYLHDKHRDTQAPDIAGAVVDPLLATDPLHLSHNLRRGIEWCANGLSAAVAVVLHGESPISQSGIEPVVEIVKSGRVDGRRTVVIALIGKRAAKDARIVISAVGLIDREGVLGAGAESLRAAAAATWNPVFTDLEQDVLGLFIGDECGGVL